MSSRPVGRWVLKRETKARIQGLRDALAYLVQDPMTAQTKIEALIEALTKVSEEKS